MDDISRQERWIMAWTFKLLAACVLVGVGGCASLNDHCYEKTQRARAREAWRQHGAPCKDQTCAKDYAAGWKDGFYDVATGGKGCPPVVAPSCYWKPSQILEHCDSKRLAYYDGFQDGVACALRYPQTHYLKLWSSCECPLPACENQCAPGVPCNNANCGVVSEGAEFLIEDTQPYTAKPVPVELPVDETGPVITQPQVPIPQPGPAEPIGAGLLEDNLDEDSDSSIRYVEPPLTIPSKQENASEPVVEEVEQD